MREKAFIDYYEDQKIAPSRQDISDLERHMARREALYRHLRLVPGWLTGKRLLEIGPGTGENSLYFESFQPDLYTLVEANRYAVEALEKKVADGELRRSTTEIHGQDISDYRDDRLYDLVICEGVLPGQENPADMLAHIAGFVAPGGVLIASTTNAASNVAEVCRRVLKSILIHRCASQDDLVERLLGVFAPQLDQLPGMSRSYEDWVRDNILCPWVTVPVFAPEQAIDCLDGVFDVLGTSPGFIDDWRWYKSVPLSEVSYNENACRQILRWTPAFLDYRADPEKIGHVDGAALEQTCFEICALHQEIFASDDTNRIPEFIEGVTGIVEMIDEAMPGTAQSLRDFIAAAHQLLGGSDVADFSTFASYFGRGQMFISFVKRV